MLGSLLRSLSAVAIFVLGVSPLVAKGPLAAPSLPLSFEQNRGQVDGQDLPLAIGSFALLLGCSGGSHASTPSGLTAAVTPAGTYTIKVNVQSTSATVTTPVTLIVQ